MFEYFIEYDINPVIFFDNKGNVKYCNQEAEIFLSYVNIKDIFKFAIKNAPKESSIKTEFVKIKFNDFTFNGYSVGYKDENLLGIRFLINTKKTSVTIENIEKVDLLKLLNFAMEYTNLRQSTKFKIYPDLSIREIYTNKKALLKTLIKIFEKQKNIEIFTRMKIGEYLKIKQKKYPIIEIEIKCHTNTKIESKYFEIENKNDSYIIKIPFIKEKDENNNT